MARPHKGQHKIPRVYLQEFVDAEGLVWVLDQKLNIYSQKPSKILTEADYYTVKFKSGGGTLDVETKYLGGIEAAYSKVYRDKLLKKEAISIKEKAILAIFVASMMQRQPGRRESLKKFFADVRETVEHLRNLPESSKRALAALPDTSNGNSISADELLAMGEDIGSLHTSLIPQTVGDLAQIIFDMKWAFLVRAGKTPFNTSDNPVVMVNPELESHYPPGILGSLPGLGQKHVELTLPLSSNLALLCGWMMTLDCMFVPITEEEVAGINTRTQRHARVLISSDKELLDNKAEKLSNKLESKIDI